MVDNTIEYYEQMIDYYPNIIKAIREFQVLIKTQSLQVNELHEKLEELLNNAFVETADENRLVMWEKFLEITPPDQGNQEYEEWLISRRDNILARLYQSEKFNTKYIEDIVSIFTGGTAEAWLLDSTLYVKIYPTETNKSFDIDSVIKELTLKCPAHLNLVVYKNYITWDEVSKAYTWGDINTTFNNWNELIGDIPQHNIFEYVVDENGGYITDESNSKLFN